MVSIDTRVTWSPHIDKIRKRTAQKMCMLCPLLNKKRYISVRNGVLLYKQLIRPLMDCARPASRFVAAPSQIHEDPGVPLFATMLEP